MVYDLAEWLDPEGDFPRDHPAVRKNLKLVALILQLGSELPSGESALTTMSCTKQVKRQPCPGLLVVRKEEDGSVSAQCPSCHLERFLVCNWESTPWREALPS